MTTATAIRFETLVGFPKAGVVRFVEVPARRCFAVDGEGAPGGPAFQAAFAVLYPAAYALHFAMRRAGRDAKVGTLEGLWSRRDGRPFTAIPDIPADPDDWRWTLLIPTPDEATEAEIDAAMAAARAKVPGAAAGLLRCARFDAEPSAETLHVGPYSAEAPTVALLHRAIEVAGYRDSGPHHEIYTGNPRVAKPEKLRTIIRQRVTPAG